MLGFLASNISMTFLVRMSRSGDPHQLILSWIWAPPGEAASAALPPAPPPPGRPPRPALPPFLAGATPVPGGGGSSLQPASASRENAARPRIRLRDFMEPHLVATRTAVNSPITR